MLLSIAILFSTSLTPVISLTIPSSFLSSSHLTNLTTDLNIPLNCHPPSRSLPKLCMDDCLDALLLFTMNHPLPSYTLTHARLAAWDEIQCPYVTSQGSCQLRIDYGRGEGQVVNPTSVFEPRVQELVDECVDGKGWGWGGMIGGIDAGGDAVVWVEVTEGKKRGQLDRRGAEGCQLGVGNGTAMGNGGRIDGDPALAALT